VRENHDAITKVKGSLIIREEEKYEFTKEYEEINVWRMVGEGIVGVGLLIVSREISGFIDVTKLRGYTEMYIPSYQAA
jgi:hypothetical protein